MNGNSAGSRQLTPQVLREVLERASNPAAIFTLYVHDGANERVVYFVSGGVRLLSAGARGSLSLADYILAKGFLPIDVMHESLEEVRTKNRPLKDVLLERKILTRDDVTSLTNKLIRDEIMDLVFWPDAEFTIFTGSPPQELYDRERRPLVGTLDLASLCEEVSEWCHRWERLRPRLRSDEARVSLTPKGEKVARDPFAGSHDLCVKIGEGSSLRSIAQAMGLELPAACEFVVELQDRGLIDIQSPPLEERDEDQIANIEAALPGAILADRLLERLASLQERTGANEAAAKSLAALAEIHVRQTEWPRGVEMLKRALELDPRNLDHFVRFATLQTSHNLVPDVLQFSKRHIVRLLGLNESELADRISRELARITGDTKRSEGVLQEAIEQSSRPASAIDQFLLIADEYCAAGTPEKAIEALKQALSLDSRNEAVRDRLTRLDRDWARRNPSVRTKRAGARHGRRVLVPLVALTLLALSATLAWALWPRLAAAISRFTQSSSEGEGSDEDGKLSAPPTGSDPEEWIEYLDQQHPENPRHEVDPDSIDEAQRLREETVSRLGSITRTSAGSAPRRDGSEDGAREDRSARPAGSASARSSNPSSSAIDRPEAARVSETSRAVVPRGTRQDLDSSRYVIFGDSADLRGFDRRTDREIFRFGGASGARWALGLNGEVICRWRPGDPCKLFDPRTRSVKTTDWTLPAGTDALAIGTNRVVVRDGERTGIYDLEGNPLAGARLAPWNEGFFSPSGVVLLGPVASDSDTPQEVVSLLDPTTLRVLWSVRSHSGRLSW